MYNRLCVEHTKRTQTNRHREKERKREDHFSVGSVKMTEIPYKSEGPVQSIKTTRTSHQMAEIFQGWLGVVEIERPIKKKRQSRVLEKSVVWKRKREMNTSLVAVVADSTNAKIDARMSRWQTVVLWANPRKKIKRAEKKRGIWSCHSGSSDGTATLNRHDKVVSCQA